jgi:primosomal protein N' (replication factor Y)
MEKEKRRYYEVALLGSASPHLVYHCDTQEPERGSVVTVPVRNSLKKAVVTGEVSPPDFTTKSISEVSDFVYDLPRYESAVFMATYYHSSLGEALSLFSPRRKSSTPPEKVDIDELELPVLSSEQKIAFETLWREKRALLFGVTGSGKTEIYITAMARILSEGKSAILLMPEISLTPQMEKRLKRHFGERVAIWHSKIGKKRREEIERGIESGRISIVAGARSALFVPLSNVGLVIVDEEHDDSYKSMSRPRYHARDFALYLAQKLDARVWLGSATPSLSSYMKYPVCRLKSPYVRSEKSYRFVNGPIAGEEILGAIRENMRRGEQSLLFVPTRGNFKYLWCEMCGKTQLCPHCAVGMSLHRGERLLMCHYCNHTERIRESCSYCGHSPLKSDRPGTAEVVEMLEERIEGIRVVRMDRDTASTPSRLKKILSAIENGECDVVVGTQMLSKGHDYHDITLSIVTGLDYLLGISDYRASERAVGLLHQIAGRSGRSKKAQVLIQSSMESYFAPYLEDYEKFLESEKEFARDLYPPFVSLARVLISDRDESRGDRKRAELTSRFSTMPEIEVVGSGKAPIEKIAGRYRFNILLRSRRRTPLLKALSFADGNGVEVDMDPVDFS